MCDCGRREEVKDPRYVVPTDERAVLANIIWEETINEKKGQVIRRAAVCLAHFHAKEGWRALHPPLRIDDQDESQMPLLGLHIDGWREIPRPSVSHYEECALYPTVAG